MELFERFVHWFTGSRNNHPPPKSDATGVDLAALESALKYTISHPDLFAEALSHRSYLQVSGIDPTSSNERLEYLGDSVLNLAVAEYLFRKHSDSPEGDLTKMRSQLVNRKALAVYAREVQLARFMRMSPSALQIADKGMETILADAFEAIIGAIYIDGGFDQAKIFVERHVLSALNRGAIRIDGENYKSMLLEHTQAGGLGTPRYNISHQEGPDHDRTFTVEVIVNNVAYGFGVGKNKKDAEQAAAEQAYLSILKGEPPLPGATHRDSSHD